MDYSDEPSEKQHHSDFGDKKSEEVDIKLPKKGIIAAVIILVVLLLAGLVWQTGAYKRIWAMVMPATLDVTVTDKDTTKPISDASVTIDNTTSKTDKDGKVSIAGLSVRQISVKISATGYFSVDQTVKLQRKSNSLSTTLTLNIEKTTVVGKVSDFVTDAVLADVDVTINGKIGKTDATGKYSIAEIPTGEQTIDISKTGYNKKSEKLTILKDKIVEQTIVPAGKVYFISNRDAGKRGIYVCDYDGSNTAQLVKRVGDTEDYNLTMSPDRTKIGFLSTRASRKNANGSIVSDLYVINADGSKLTKLDSSFGLYSMQWTSDSKYLLWSSSPVETQSSYNINSYSTKTGNTEKLNANGSASYFTLSHDGKIAVWSQSTISGDPTSVAGAFYRTLSGGDPTKVSDKSVSGLNFSENDTAIRYSYWDQATSKSIYESFTISDGTIATYTPTSNSGDYKIISPDKKKYAYSSNRDGKTDVFISDLDGKNERKLTTLGTVNGLSWELNSDYILFDSTKTAENAKYIVSISGGEAKKVTDEFAYDYGRMGY